MLPKGTRVKVISNKHHNGIEPLLNLVGTIIGKTRLSFPSPYKETLYDVDFGYVPGYGDANPWYVYEDDMVNADSKFDWFRGE